MQLLTKRNKRFHFLTVAILVLVCSTILAWGVATGFGSTHIQRYTVPAENGTNMSYVAWIPDNATDETPAPAVILWPGRSSNSHQMDNWALEFARNGYVAINVDWNGNGETDLMSSQEEYVTALMESVLDMPFVDPENLAVLGNSAGNGAATIACALYPDQVVAYIDDVHPRLLENAPEHINIQVIEAVHDQYVQEFVGDQNAVFQTLTEAWGLESTVVENQYYGSAEDGTLRQFVITNTIHQISALDTAGIAAAVEFLGKVFPNTIPNPPSGQVLGFYQLFQIFGYAGIIMFILAFGIFLFEQVPYFNAIGNDPTINRGLRGTALGKNIAFALIVPLITFFPVSWWFHNREVLNPVFQSRNLRGIIGWLVTNAVINLVILAVKASRARKEGRPLTAAELGFAGEGETLKGYKIWRAFLLACLTVFTAYAWVKLVDMTLGINYQIWNVLNISAIPANRILPAIPFICCTMIIMFAGNIGMNTSRRLADTGNPTRDMVRQIVLNVLVSAGVVTGLLLAQYGIGWLTGVYMMPQLENVGGGTSSGALDFSFGFPLIMGFSGGMSTYFYRKTNNIWIGMFISALLGGFVGVVGSTFITGHAVM